MYPAEVQPRELVYLFVVIAAVLVLRFGVRLLRPTVDTREAPLVSPRILVFGHALGLLLYGVPYYAMTTSVSLLLDRKLTSSPIYTFDLYATKMYIVNSGRLVSAVQRNHKVISFDPFLTAAASRTAGITGKGLRLLQEKQGGGGGLNAEVVHAMHPALLGPALDVMNGKMISGLCSSVDALSNNGDSSLDLHVWCRRSITSASTKAVWGPGNLYESEDLRSAFCTLLLNLWPKYTATAAWTAREKIVKAFTEYFIPGGYRDSSELTVARWRVQHDAGATTEDIASLKTASTDIPKELKTNALVIDPNTSKHIVDLGLIRDGCPKLISAFQEVLRVRSNGAPTPVVYDDVMLDDRYLLKADSVVQMVAPAVNKEETVCGPSTQQFDSSRFGSITKEKGPSVERPRATSYMSFGAYPNMCPGRHFAAGEILALVAMLILRYDITPVSGERWSPKLNAWAIAASVSPPAGSYPVKLSARKEYAGASRSFNVTEGKGKFILTTG